MTETAKAWRLKNRERILASKKAWYQANKATCLEKCKVWAANNHEKVLAASRKWRKTHPEEAREFARQQISKYPERAKARNLKKALRWAAAHRAEASAKSRKWAIGHPEERRAQSEKRRTAKTGAGGSYTPAEWRLLKAQHGNACACCGASGCIEVTAKERAGMPGTKKCQCCGMAGCKIKLTADHVVPVAFGGTSFISNIQPLCQSCNSKKHARVIDYRAPQELAA